MNYVNNGDLVEEMWGVTTSGAVFTTALTEYNVDPLYPSPYGKGVKDGSIYKKEVDWCLSDTNLARMYHYKTPSICLANSTNWDIKDLPQTGDVKSLIRKVWQEVPFRTAIGISKDGRPILSPYKEGGRAYSDCEVDICNGVTVDGNYMYATTLFHPYVMGCYGRGNKVELYQECSENPRLCNIEYTGVAKVEEEIALKKQ